MLVGGASFEFYNGLIRVKVVLFMFNSFYGQ